MSDYLVKTIVATALLAAGLTSFLSMMALMGKSGEKPASEKLRRLHKVSGIAYLFLLLPLVYFGGEFLSELGEGLSVRAVFHFVLAALLLAVVVLKFLVARFYRQFLKYAPGLGMAIFVLTVAIYLITAGYFFLRGGALE